MLFKFPSIAWGSILLLSHVLLLRSVQAQALEQTPVAFTSERKWGYSGLDIWVMDAEGGNLRNLTDSPNAIDQDSAWSPDGTRIAFVTRREGLHTEIFVMDVDGGNPRNLTNHPGTDDDPAGSPNGRRIAFSSSRQANEDNVDLYIMDDDNQITDTRVRKTALNGRFNVRGMSLVLAEGFCRGAEFLYIKIQEAPDHAELLQ